MVVHSFSYVHLHQVCWRVLLKAGLVVGLLVVVSSELYRSADACLF